MKISLIQIESTDDKQANFDKVNAFINDAYITKPDIICLSENFLYRGDDKEKEVEMPSSRFITGFQELAKSKNINIVLGSIILMLDHSEKPKNSCLIIDRSGKIIYRYDKQYLYDVERDDVTYRESDFIQPGNTLGFFKLEGVPMGVGICIDLRYPEYFRELIKKGAEIIFLPSNFRKITGQLAWDVLTKARAIENQTFFCACGQTGGTGNKIRCGNSRIISFDGTNMAEIGEEEGIVSANIDLEMLYKFRKEFPVLNQMK